jgi:hypothetical protein
MRCPALTAILALTEISTLSSCLIIPKTIQMEIQENKDKSAVENLLNGVYYGVQNMGIKGAVLTYHLLNPEFPNIPEDTIICFTHLSREINSERKIYKSNFAKSEIDNYQREFRMRR